MDIGGYDKETDYKKLGPPLLIASCLVLAIRTARWTSTPMNGTSNMEWSHEVDVSVRIARMVLTHLLSKAPGLFPNKDVAWYVPNDEDNPR